MASTDYDKMTDEEVNHAVHVARFGSWDATRCPVCGWAYFSHDKARTGLTYGCVPGNCAQRPMPSVRADAPLDICGDYTRWADFLMWLRDRHVVTALRLDHDGRCRASLNWAHSACEAEARSPGRALALAFLKTGRTFGDGVLPYLEQKEPTP